jgi:hypothetical protein
MREMLAKTKEFVKTYQKDVVLILGVALVSLISFAAGYLVAKDQLKGSVIIERTYDEQ